MDLIADRGRRVPVEELNTSRLLAHARKQAVRRKLDDMLIVDVEAGCASGGAALQLAAGAIRAGQQVRTNRSTMMLARFDVTLPANRVRVDAVERLATVADEAGLTLIQLALGFVTAHPGVTSAIIGPRTLDHLHSQLAAAETELSDDILDAIDDSVAPGTDLAAQEKNDTPPALLDPSLRRRDLRRPDGRAGGIFAGNVA